MVTKTCLEFIQRQVENPAYKEVQIKRSWQDCFIFLHKSYSEENPSTGDDHRKFNTNIDRDQCYVRTPKKNGVLVNGESINGNIVDLVGHSFIATQAPHLMEGYGGKPEPLEHPRETFFWECIMKHGISAVFCLEKNCKYTATMKQPRMERSSTISDNHISAVDTPNGVAVAEHRLDIANREPHTYTFVETWNWTPYQGIAIACLDELVRQAESIRRKHPDQPILVHCIAGLDRKGTFIVACALKELNDRGELTLDNYVTLIFALVLSFGIQRSPDELYECQLKALNSYAMYLLEN